MGSTSFQRIIFFLLRGKERKINKDAWRRVFFLVSGDNQPEIGEVGRGRETAPNQTEAAGGETAWILRRRTARSQEGWRPQWRPGLGIPVNNEASSGCHL